MSWMRTAMTTEVSPPPVGPAGPQVPSRPAAVQATLVLGVMLMGAAGLVLVADTDRQLAAAELAEQAAEQAAIEAEQHAASMAAAPPADGMLPAPAPRRVVVVRRRTRAS